MKSVLAGLIALALAACAGAPSGGFANYDALKAAQAECAARGGSLKLKSAGNPAYIEDFACKRN